MDKALGTGDRVLRALFVAWAVGLGWAIRGDFGHLVGAMYPGAALGLGFAYVSGQRAGFRWMPVLGAMSALLIGAGGRMSYGILHGYAQSDTFINYSYGLFTLFLQGGAWGCFAGAALGLLLEEKPVRLLEGLGAAAAVFAGGWTLWYLVYVVAGFDINPYRSNAATGYTGGVIGLMAWLALNRRPYGLRGALLGFIGFGLGMSLGRLMANVARVQDYFAINDWNVMEMTVGLVGGFIFTFGMLGKPMPDPPQERNFSWLAVFGAVFTLGMIPLLHRLRRIDPEEKLEQWAESLAGYGVSAPEAVAERTLLMLNAVVVLGFIGAALWMYFHFRGRERFGALPVLWLSLTMLLFQNLNALFFHYTRQPNTLNMHVAFWVLFALMVAYVLVRESTGGHAPATSSPEPWNAVPWRRYAAGALVGYVLVVLGAAVVNGPETMTSANTRWPIWSWRDGPFPGREAPPAP